ncbi:hypothetical protein JW977_02220 [Candidatus Falkowbacteria bacterium]|nr:hypothetical protein [Candidatus Falkowbacteria bacterium]
MANKNKNGYIALISVIIISAVVLILALGLAFISISEKQTIISHNKSLRNYYLANACANYAILQLQKNSEYAGNETISLDAYSCQIESVFGKGNTNRSFITSSQIDDQKKVLKIELDQIKPVTIIKSWGELYE